MEEHNGETGLKKSNPIRITDERWTHVVESHDYMAGNLELVVETIENPDYIVAGRKGEFIVLRITEVLRSLRKLSSRPIENLLTMAFLLRLL